MKPGDFSSLAEDYSKYRPGYSPTVLRALLGLVGNKPSSLDFVDVGAGTAIWTTMVADAGVRSAKAVEPNDEMRRHGMVATRGNEIEWFSGSAERTGLPSASADWVSMASSFHWADFELATQEFRRILRPGGYFSALWNPRLIELNPLLVEIESHLETLRPDIKRVSSGRSGITDTLSDRLTASPFFEDVVYVEGTHVVKMTTEGYLGAWRSVNDLRVQLGPDKFEAFLDFVQSRIRGLPLIEAAYLTRSWTARRKD
jgi:ubiquinone/menaquinone biosynthesis C-methylase UbiE